jgi:hypothetical protein
MAKLAVLWSGFMETRWQFRSLLKQAASDWKHIGMRAAITFAVSALINRRNLDASRKLHSVKLSDYKQNIFKFRIAAFGFSQSH